VCVCDIAGITHDIAHGIAHMTDDIAAITHDTSAWHSADHACVSHSSYHVCVCDIAGVTHDTSYVTCLCHMHTVGRCILSAENLVICRYQ